MLFSTFYLDAWNVLQTMVTTIRYFLKLLLRATKIPASGLQLCTSWCYWFVSLCPRHMWRCLERKQPWSFSWASWPTWPWPRTCPRPHQSTRCVWADRTAGRTRCSIVLGTFLRYLRADMMKSIFCIPYTYLSYTFKRVLSKETALFGLARVTLFLVRFLRIIGKVRIHLKSHINDNIKLAILVL